MSLITKMTQRKIVEKKAEIVKLRWQQAILEQKLAEEKKKKKEEE